MGDKLKQGIPLATVAAIVGITILQAIALIKGIDGTMFATSLMAIAGLGGYIMGTKFSSQNERGETVEWERTTKKKSSKKKS